MPTQTLDKKTGAIQFHRTPEEKLLVAVQNQNKFLIAKLEAMEAEIKALKDAKK